MSTNRCLRTIVARTLYGTFLFACAVLPVRAVTLEWTRQFGSPALEYNIAVSADALGSIYVTGTTHGSLAASAGSEDAFLAKYDAAGNIQWTKQFGTSGHDYGERVSTDELGNVYVSVSIFGSLGEPNVGSEDAYLAKYDSGGNLQWARQFGTSDNEFNYGVSADGVGNIYVAGITRGSLAGPNAGDYDAFVAKYDAAGNLQWTKQFGSAARDQVNGVSADALGNVYVSGWTLGDLVGPNLGGDDAYLVRYDAAGNLQWMRQFGSTGGDGNAGVWAAIAST